LIPQILTQSLCQLALDVRLPWYEDAISSLAKTEKIASVELGSGNWFEVDTRDDYAALREMAWLKSRAVELC
jgi:hypothetical protein